MLIPFMRVPMGFAVRLANYAGLENFFGPTRPVGKVV